MFRGDSLHSKMLKLNQRLPRYTSYPTSPQFTPAIDASTYSGWLAEIPEQSSLSLYVHIPFCKQLCWYCGCHTKATRQYEPVKKFVSPLNKEIKLIGEKIGGDRMVDHIHFGGGSPSILSPEDFESIISNIGRYFNIAKNAEIAMELDPRRVSEGKVAAYARNGINRISLGVQDFDRDVQKAINREQPFRNVYGAVKLLRDYGINKINMDLMYGLPRQSLDIVNDNVSKALLLKPDRLAVFGYAHVPWMKKHMRLIDENELPGAQERLEMFEVSAQKIETSGYTPIGLDHFARAGDAMETALHERRLRRNFQGYTTDRSDAIIGFGPSSIGMLPSGYVQNTLDMISYERAVNDGMPATIKGIRLTDTDRLHQDLIENIMCYLDVDVAKICQKYGVTPNLFDDVLHSLADLVSNDLVSISDRRISIHPKARQVARFVSAAFDQYHNVNFNKHSQVA